MRERTTPLARKRQVVDLAALGVCLAAGYGLGHALSHSLAMPSLPYLGPMVGVACSPHLARIARRRLGLDLDSGTGEKVPLAGAQRERALEGGPVIARMPKRAMAQAAGAVTLLAIGTGVMASFSSPLWWVPAAAYAGLATVVWRLCRKGGLALAEVDAEGIRSFGQRIPWDQVAACRIVTRSSATGHPSSITCVVEGHDGRELLTIPLSGVPPEERQRFLDYVTAGRAGRPELIAAEAPAGRGTELAAMAQPGELPPDWEEDTPPPEPSPGE